MEDHKMMLWRILRSRYQGMMDRCYNSNNPSFHRYGGRGITVCKKWQLDFLFFYTDAVSPLTRFIEEVDVLPEIDRINNDGIYEPSNCRWIDRDGNMMNSTAYNKKPIDNRYKDLTFKFDDFDPYEVLSKLNS